MCFKIFSVVFLLLCVVVKLMPRSRFEGSKVQGSKVQGSKVQGSKVQGSRFKV